MVINNKKKTEQNCKKVQRYHYLKFWFFIDSQSNFRQIVLPRSKH